MTPRQLERLVELRAPPLVPEAEVVWLPEKTSFEAFRTAAANWLARPTPYWAISWPGGQALARYLLDHPDLSKERHVVDLGCGNGLVAIAAALCGARSVLAVDLDPDALLATDIAAERMGLRVDTQMSPMSEINPKPGAVICAADMWYDAAVGRHATDVLLRLSADNDVLISDANRSYRPRKNAHQLANYYVPVSLEFESASPMQVAVASFRIDPIRRAHPLHACQG